jgi:hypothetical protein
MIAIAMASILLLSGFAVGRMLDTPKTTAAEDDKAATSQVIEDTSTRAAKENQAFYLSDFKTGYSEGYNAGVALQSSNVAATDREGFNDGFKQGYADGYQVRMNEQPTQVSRNLRPATSGTRFAQQQVVYQPAPRKKNSTLKTVLTIAAPAAVGAGVGGAVGGKKGAGVGALIGGGGGALYHLIKNRDQ